MELVERSDHREALLSAYDESRERTQTVLLEGAPGMGKTALLDAFLGEAAGAGAAVFRATAVGWHSPPPLGVALRLLASMTGPVDAPTGWDVADLFASALRAVAAESAVIIAIDDLDHIDAESLECLLYTVHRLKSVNVLLVCTQLSADLLARPAVRTELVRMPHIRTMFLDPLSREAVACVLVTEEPRLARPDHADWYHQVSGGNPLLLRALLTDHRAPREGSGERVVSQGFQQAFTTCLQRAAPHVAELAAGVALLGEHSTVDRLGQLLGLSPTVVAQRLAALRASRMMRDHGFRHTAAAMAALDALGAGRQAGLHRRAAAVLSAAGAPTTAIARHFQAATDVDDPWELTVLQEAAEQALVEDDPSQAISFLEQARWLCRDSDRRLAITLRLAAVTRRTDLVAAEQHLAEPLTALREDRLPIELYGPLVQQLVGQGRYEEGHEVRDRLERRAQAPGRSLDPADHLEAVVASLRAPLLMPVQALRAQLGVPDEPDAASEIAATFSEEIAGVSPLTEATIDTILGALATLRAHGRLDLALRWSQSLVDEAKARNMPGWAALLLAESAATSLRRGDLTTAERSALIALGHITDWEGSVFVRWPLATLVLVHLHRGRPADAAGYLGRAVTSATLTNAPGLAYRRARGRHYLATNRVHAALSDFLHVGQAAQRWGIDDPSIPWHTDAAEALLRLGANGPAETLLAEVLAHRGSSWAWSRGIALRLRASLAPADHRVEILLDATDTLRRSGDMIELGLALADLADAHNQDGEHEAAKRASTQARRLAKQSGAEALRRRLRLSHGTHRTNRGAPSPTVDRHERLTGSERRVAALAASGATNREIAEKLYITTSTVEQHLTSVYRKLEIAGRRDLPPALLGVG